MTGPEALTFVAALVALAAAMVTLTALRMRPPQVKVKRVTTRHLTVNGQEPLLVILHNGICAHEWPHTQPCEPYEPFAKYPESKVHLDQLADAGFGVRAGDQS